MLGGREAEPEPGLLFGREAEEREGREDDRRAGERAGCLELVGDGELREGMLSAQLVGLGTCGGRRLRRAPGAAALRLAYVDLTNCLRGPILRLARRLGPFWRRLVSGEAGGVPEEGIDGGQSVGAGGRAAGQAGEEGGWFVEVGQRVEEELAGGCLGLEAGPRLAGHDGGRQEDVLLLLGQDQVEPLRVGRRPVAPGGVGAVLELILVLQLILGLGEPLRGPGGHLLLRLLAARHSSRR